MSLRNHSKTVGIPFQDTRNLKGSVERFHQTSGVSGTNCDNDSHPDTCCPNCGLK